MRQSESRPLDRLVSGHGSNRLDLPRGSIQSRREPVLESVLAQWGDQVAFYISQVAAERDEKDRAFELLERARRNGEPDLVMAVSEPMLRSLHNDPRWAQFRENIGRSEERLAAVEFEVSEPGG